MSRAADASPPVDARAALSCCLAAGFATLLDATVVAYTAPTVASTLDATTSGVQWFLAAYSLTFGLGLLPAGRLGDAFGRRGLFVGGMLVFLLLWIADVLLGAINSAELGQPAHLQTLQKTLMLRHRTVDSLES